MKRLAIYLSAIVSAVLFFTSCEGNIPVKDKSLYGKWGLYARECPIPPEFGGDVVFDSIDTYLTFNKDNTFVVESDNKKVIGKYWVYNNATIKVLEIDDSLLEKDDYIEKYDFIKRQMPDGVIVWCCYEFGAGGDLILSCPPDYTGCNEYYRK